MTATVQHDFRAATADAKRRLEGAKRLQHLAARRAAEAFLAGDVPAADDVAGSERVLQGLAALEVRARFAELGQHMESFKREAKELPELIPSLDERLTALHNGRVPEIQNLVERDREMNALRSQIGSLTARIARCGDRVFDLGTQQTELTQKHPEAFIEADRAAT